MRAAYFALGRCSGEELLWGVNLLWGFALGRSCSGEGICVRLILLWGVNLLCVFALGS